MCESSHEFMLRRSESSRHKELDYFDTIDDYVSIKFFTAALRVRVRNKQIKYAFSKDPLAFLGRS
jgi:hypothetical protein